MGHFSCPLSHLVAEEEFTREVTVDLSNDLHKKFTTWYHTNNPTGLNEIQRGEITVLDMMLKLMTLGVGFVVDAVQENEDTDVPVLQVGRVEGVSQGEQCKSMCMDLERQLLNVHLYSLNAYSGWFLLISQLMESEDRYKSYKALPCMLTFSQLDNQISN